VYELIEEQLGVGPPMLVVVYAELAMIDFRSDSILLLHLWIICNMLFPEKSFNNNVMDKELTMNTNTPISQPPIFFIVAIHKNAAARTDHIPKLLPSAFIITLRDATFLPKRLLHSSR
jgi:hypothetical protein